MLPSLPIICTASSEGLPNPPDGTLPKGDGNQQHAPDSFKSATLSLKEIVISHVPTSYEVMPPHEKECYDELVLKAENSSHSEKRKLPPHNATPKKKKKLELSSLTINEYEKECDNISEHFADAYLNKAQQLLDETTFNKFLALFASLSETDSALSIYEKVQVLLSDYPDLLNNFVGFLQPHQAWECGKFAEFLFFQKTWHFCRKLDLYNLAKVCHVMEHFSENIGTTRESLMSAIKPLMKSHPHLFESFKSLFPGERPVQSNECDYEDVSGLLGSENDYETISIPPFADRVCSGPAICSCQCHSAALKVYCTGCNIKFINGQIYVHTGKELRFARLSMAGLKKEELLRRLYAPLLKIPRARKKSNCKPKGESPKSKDLKDKPMKAGAISATEVEGFKEVPEPEEEAQPPSPLDEAQIEVLDFEKECKDSDLHCDLLNNEEDDYCEEDDKLSELSSEWETSLDSNGDTPESQETKVTGDKEKPLKTPVESSLTPNAKQANKGPTTATEETGSSLSTSDIQEKQTVISEKVDKVGGVSSKVVEERMWTRDEDKVILQAFQKELGTEHIFSKISSVMPSRSVNDIQRRFQVLMSLLERLTCGYHDPPSSS